MPVPTDAFLTALESAPTGTADVTLTLRPLPDPQAAGGHPARDPAYRLRLVLKRLLRDYGFRCLSCRPAPDRPAAGQSGAVESVAPAGE